MIGRVLDFCGVVSLILSPKLNPAPVPLYAQKEE